MTSLHRPEYKALIVELVKARKAADITQAELASRLNKPQSFVAKYEKAERRLDVIEFIEIAGILGADYRGLIGMIYPR